MNVNQTLLVDRHVSKVKRKAVKKAFDLSTALQIEKVAEHSLADKLGLKPGDYLLKVNGLIAAKRDMWAWAQQSSNHTYLYFLPTSQETLSFHSTGIPIGVNLERTNQAIVEQYIKGKGCHEDLTVLWERYEWESLNRIRQNFVDKSPGMIARRVQKLMGKSYLCNNVEWLYQGITIYENGYHEDGMKIIEEFAEEYSQNWQMTYSSLVLFYRAKEILRGGNRERALQAFLDCYLYCDLDPCAFEIKKLGAMPPSLDSPWTGLEFPADYNLPVWENDQQRVTLANALDGLAEGELHVICSLAGYLSNQPYSRFMQRFIVFSKYFGDLFKSLHVITAKKELGYWQEKEEEAISLGLNISILYDANDEVSQALDMANSPVIFMLDRHGQIVCQDSLYRETKLWDFLVTCYG